MNRLENESQLTKSFKEKQRRDIDPERSTTHIDPKAM